MFQPGDYIKFVNLHAAEYKQTGKPDKPTVELCLHRGNSFGRCVKVVSPDSSELDQMKQRQEIIALDNDSFSISGVTSNVNSGQSTDGTEESNSVTREVNSQEPSTSKKGDKQTEIQASETNNTTLKVKKVTENLKQKKSMLDVSKQTTEIGDSSERRHIAKSKRGKA